MTVKSFKQASSMRAFKATVLQTVTSSSAQIGVTSVTDGHPDKSVLQTIIHRLSAASISVEYQLSLICSAKLLPAYQSKLSFAVHSGVFTSSLRANAHKFNATALYTASSSSISFGKILVHDTFSAHCNSDSSFFC